MGREVTDYDPDRSDIPWDGQIGGEVWAAKYKTPAPVKKGDRVLYRHNDHDDLTDAVVVKVEHDFPKQIIETNGLITPIPPWPTLTLDTLYGPIRTREARVRGSAGWLPLAWVDA